MNKRFIVLCFALLLTGCDDRNVIAPDDQSSNLQGGETQVTSIADENIGVNSNFRFKSKCVETTESKTMFEMNGSVYEKGIVFEITNVAKEIDSPSFTGTQEYYFIESSADGYDTVYVGYDEESEKYYYYPSVSISYSIATFVNIQQQIESCSFELSDQSKVNNEQIDKFITDDAFYSFSVFGGMAFEKTTITFNNQTLTTIAGTISKKYNSVLFENGSDNLSLMEETTIYDIGKVEAPHEVYPYNG